MILCLGTTPAVQRVMVFRKIALDAVNRAAATAEGPAGKSINVARVLKQLGERPFAIGFLGGERGKFITAALDQYRNDRAAADRQPDPLGGRDQLKVRLAHPGLGRDDEDLEELFHRVIEENGR